MKKGIIITLVILAAIGAGVGLYFWLRKKPDSSTPAPGTKEDTKSTTPATATVKPDKINTEAVKAPIMPQTSVEQIPATPFVLVKTDLTNATEAELPTDFSNQTPGFGRG